MVIRKKQGEPDGWAVAVCLKTATGYDDNDDPFQVVEGEEYFTKGDFDPNIFELVEKPAKKTKPIKEEEEE